MNYKINQLRLHNGHITASISVWKHIDNRRPLPLLIDIRVFPRDRVSCPRRGRFTPPLRRVQGSGRGCTHPTRPISSSTRCRTHSFVYADGLYAEVLRYPLRVYAEILPLWPRVAKERTLHLAVTLYYTLTVTFPWTLRFDWFINTRSVHR